MDSNSKLGPEIIPQDPHNQSQNGAILAGIIERHGLVVGNSLSAKCVGSITRRRKTINSEEESIIDHVLISEDLENDLESIIIDEEGENALTKVLKTKKGVKTKSSDHNPIITNFSMKWSSKVTKPRIEMFNLKNKEGQEKFKQLTSNSTMLTDIVSSKDDINICTKKFLKSLNQCIRKSFKKIRITDKPNIEIESLFNQRRKLRSSRDEKSRCELEEVEKKLADFCAQSNYEKIKEEIENINCDEGGFNSGHLWKLKKKMSPKCRDPPTAMLDNQGNLVTTAKAIEALAVETYRKRLENREINKDLESLKKEKEELCKLRLRLASSRKTPDWTMEQLEVVLDYLKKNKSRDPLGYANDIFKSDVAGNDLKQAILILLNRIKRELIYPKVLEDVDISSIYKNKGCRNSFEYYRGIFRVPILRTILDRLIYNDEYYNIDENLSDCNVGARKNRNIRDNIFVLNAINNSIVNGDEGPVDIKVFDVEKCFDSLWVEECINDIFEAGLKNDKLALIFLTNQNANIAIKTPGGKSDRISIKNIIMQGTVWGSLLCTATMDRLGKQIYRNPDLTYKYKGVVETPSLGMVDDILCVQKCSNDTVKVNAVVNAFIEGKKLKLSDKKCKRIHLQNKKLKRDSNCPEIKVHQLSMESSVQEKYLGDFINNNGTNRNTIEERKNKGFGIVNEIIAILDEIPLGRFKMEIGLQLRQAMLLNGMLYNSEAWHSVSETEMRMLETVDECLLRTLVKGHAKTPLEFLYLEAGATPIRFIISSRRLLYHQVILKREESELTKRVYKEQIRNPSKGDFVELIKEDFKSINEVQNDDMISNTNTTLYKKHIKAKIKISALKYLTDIQAKHSKVKDIKYLKLETQKYMTSPIFSNEEVNLLHALRSRSTECKENFKQKYIYSNLLCSLGCNENENQQHILTCTVIKEKYRSENLAINQVEYENIFSTNINKQKEVTQLYMDLFKIRDTLLEDNSQQDPSPTDVELLMSNNLLDCTVYSSSGK